MNEPPAGRDTLALEYKWNAESVFASIQHWQTEYDAVRLELEALSDWKGRLSEGPRLLLQALQEREKMLVRALTLNMWATICQSVDAHDELAGQQTGQSEGLISQVQAAAAFYEPELLAIEPALLDSWLQSDPELGVYTHYIHDLRRKATHVRSAEVEEVLGQASETIYALGTTHRLLTAADLKFAPARSQDGQEQPVTQSNFHALLASPDRTLRQTAYQAYHDAYLVHQQTLASNLLASVKADNFMARARRYAQPLEWALFPNALPASVFHNLLAVIERHQSTWHRYFEIRRRALRLELLAPYDIWAPLTPDPARIPYPQAVEWICASLAPLGQDYVETVRRGCLEQRWVDVYPAPGKSSGAFSWGSPGTYPFIIMNYTDEVTSLSILAHELGHSMHSHLTNQTQPLIYSGYSTFAAEVASNFHQALLRAYLLEVNPDPVFQINLIEEALANFYRYFLVMPALARFEADLHDAVWRGQGMSAAEMNDKMAGLLGAAWGPAMAYDLPQAGISWATFSHLYSAYYVFQYATGISGANALAQRVRQGVPGAVEAYLAFLRSGGSQYPLQALQSAGVDLSSPLPVEAAFEVLADYIERLDQLLA